MTSIGNIPWSTISLTSLTVLVLFLSGCAPAPTPAPDITKGSTRAEVTASLGEPDRTQDFVIPDQPFFGPQESLVNLLPPGAVVEEWVYEIEDEHLYVWFAAQDEEPRQDWRVIEFMSYPRDAVY